MKGYLRLVRWDNLLFLSVMLWALEKWVAVLLLVRSGMYELMPWWLLALLTAAVVLIAAGGYVINDYFDIKIDRINRPDRLIVSTSVSKKTAMHLFEVLTAIGLICGLIVAYYVKSLPLTMVMLLVPGLLWFYSASYKRIFLIGNLVVAFVCALVPFTIALCNTALIEKTMGEWARYVPVIKELVQWSSGFALFAFLTTLIREMVKDLQDLEGDRELECHTLPVVWGINPTRICVTVLIAIVVALLAVANWYVLPFDNSWGSLSTRYVVFGFFVPLACETALLWSAKIPSDYRTAQGLMKFIMFLGVMYSFVIMRML